MTPSEIRTWRFVACMLGAASLGIALAHAMHLPALDRVDAENAPLFDRVYAQMASVGAILAISTIAAMIGLVVALRERPRAQALSGVSLMLYSIGVIAWLARAPVAWAMVDLLGLAALLASVLDETPADTPVHAVRRRHDTNTRWPVQPAWLRPRP